MSTTQPCLFITKRLSYATTEREVSRDIICFSKDFYLILVEKKRRDDLSSRKSPRITKNINGYTKRMSLQKGKKTGKPNTRIEKRVHQKKKVLYQNSLQKRRRARGEGAGAKRRGTGWNHGYPDLFLY